MRRDILSAYAASGARVLSWVIVSAIVYRNSKEQFALLALVRGTLGILNYASLGLLPAMIRALAQFPASDPPSEQARQPGPPGGAPHAAPTIVTLDYATPGARPQRIRDPGIRLVYESGKTLAFIGTAVGVVAAVACAVGAADLYRIPGGLLDYTQYLIAFLGMGIALRWFSDPESAVLQAQGHIALDNALSTFAEAIWVLATAFLILRWGGGLPAVGLAYFASSLLLVVARGYAAHAVAHVSAWRHAQWRHLKPLLSTGLLITLAQLADYLYAPTDYILINHLLSTQDLANYAPALLIDGGLMLLVTGIATVLLPKAALAHAAGNRQTVRAYYLRGTLATAAMLLAAGLIAWLASPVLFNLWLGEPMPGTQAILPLVLVHTVLGGSSAVGRSILLGIGKAKPFTVAVLIAGVTNVVCSYVFVRYFHWGLRGIVLGTIVAVVARCGLWMPWYILRQLRSAPPFSGGPEGREFVIDVDATM